jgi:hypothetical protein
MGVGVVEAGDQRARAEIVQLRHRPAQRQHIGAAPTAKDAAVGDRDRLGDAAGAVQHQHVSRQNGVGGLHPHDAYSRTRALQPVS